jgi:purine-binding chemotaxis protein CheW
VPLSQVVETMRPLSTEAITGMPAFVRGLAIIRGTAVPVVDLGCLLGGGSGLPTTRFVLLRLGERRAALAVEALLGVRDLEAARLHAMPPLLQQASLELIEQVGTLDGELLVVLRVCRTVPDDLWPALSGREAAG